MRTFAWHKIITNRWPAQLRRVRSCCYGAVDDRKN